MRYGEKEKEAVASFDFLDDLSTTSSSLSCSLDETETKNIENKNILSENDDGERKIVEINNENQSSTVNNLDNQIKS